MAYSHFGDNFTGQAGDATNSVTALKDGGYWLVNQVKDQSHQAQLTKR